MGNTQMSAENALAIGSVERDTGLSKDTLRVWERRYGFPQPLRDATGERVYPVDQVERLRLIARLVNAGQRPGQVVALDFAQLAHRLTQMTPQARSKGDLELSELQVCLDLVQTSDLPRLRLTLHQAAMKVGWVDFVTSWVSPLNRMVGEAWLRGDIQVFQEHLYTEAVTGVLFTGLQAMPMPDDARRYPRVLLCTLASEPHRLGLLMAQVVLSLIGCECMSLGPQLPIDEVSRAAAAHFSHIVGLSFSPHYQSSQLLKDLRALRRQLPETVDIWAGGGHAALQKLEMPGFLAVPDLSLIPSLVAQWQTRNTNAQ
jgi:DNA-binding transcriptional MerR regulator/methylmalonyl-CoA mutase cobalamin-binding subunit